MTRNGPDVSDALVRKRFQELTIACKERGKTPSVLELARLLGLPNSTFRRRYPDIAQEIADRRTTPIVKAARQTEEVRLAARNAKLKRENHQLKQQLQLAVAQIQRLSLHNAQLEETQTAANVTHIGRRRHR
ncbi:MULTISPECIES: hypothetical protein [unclassified Rhodococcus (in: high G+C Gram-positive bacteria)]|uniref:hypothetical protein n=1 Tax=unclassified Rhodococcus (in: high G+C Gram-positive bacteria) TaxID=192944 RepID=UPI000361231F|nr:hypothetical protein [Rhodococcus sp. DK17]